MRLYDAGPDGLKTETFDSAALWERVNRDMELLRDLVDLFAQQYPALLEGIETAIEQRSFADLQKVSHKLKGSLLQFSAQDCFINWEETYGQRNSHRAMQLPFGWRTARRESGLRRVSTATATRVRRVQWRLLRPTHYPV